MFNLIIINRKDYIDLPVNTSRNKDYPNVIKSRNVKTVDAPQVQGDLKSICNDISFF